MDASRPSRFINAGKPRGIRVSFEFFPPKTAEMEQSLWEAISRLAPLEPNFVSVTYGAGGSTRERTHATVKRILAETMLTPAAHLTCVAATCAEIDAVIGAYAQAGVRHIVALRGDPLAGAGEKYAPHPGGYRNAADLVAGIKRIADIEVSVSAYPEKHPDSPSVAADIDMLKAKVDAGATRAITQFFFENDLYFRYLDRVRAARHRHPDRAGHSAGAEFQDDEDFCRALRRLGAGLARRPLRRPRRRCRNPQADRRRGRRRTGARPGRSRRDRFSLLHHEPRRPRLRDLPPARAAARQAKAKHTHRRSRQRRKRSVRKSMVDVRVNKTSPTETTLRRLAAERILVLDGAMGTMIQALQPRRGRLSRRALRRLEPRGARQQRSAQSQPAGRGARHPPRLFPRRRRHRLDQHLLLDPHRASRLRHGGDRLRTEPRRRAPRPRRRAHRARRGRQATLRHRRHRPDQPHRLDLARRFQSELSRGHLRRTARRLHRTGARPARRRRRCAADRDHLRHAQRQGRDLRHRRRARCARHRSAGDDLRHHHRPLRPAAVGPDAGSVLECDRACGAAVGRLQLRARRQADARPYRRARPRRRHADLRLSQCRPAQRIRPLRRRPRRHGGADRRIRRRRPHQYRRRLLRHHARSHPRHRPRRRRQDAARGAGHRAAAAALRPRSLHADARRFRSSMSASAPTSPARRASAS